MRPIEFNWESGTATIEWLSPTAGLIRFLYPTPAALPFRGVCCIEITGTEYEFKGMVFRAMDDAPTLTEHRAIKGYLASMGLIGKSRRLKYGRVVTKVYLGNPAQNSTVEKLIMATRTFRVTAELINEGTGKGEGKYVHETNGRTLKEVRHLQNTLKNGYEAELEAIGDQLAAAEEAASQASA